MLYGSLSVPLPLFDTKKLGKGSKAQGGAEMWWIWIGLDCQGGLNAGMLQWRCIDSTVLKHLLACYPPNVNRNQDLKFIFSGYDLFSATSLIEPQIKCL